MIPSQEFTDGLMDALSGLRGMPITSMTKDMATCEITTYLNRLQHEGKIRVPRLPDPQKWIKIGGHENTLTVEYDRRGFLRALRDLAPQEANVARTTLASLFGAPEAAFQGTPEEIEELKAMMKPIHAYQQIMKRDLRTAMREGKPPELLARMRADIRERAATLRELHQDLEDLRK